MVQDAPLLTQVPLPVPLLARMGRELEQVQLVKVEAPPTAPKTLGAACGGGRDVDVVWRAQLSVFH
jgi:4-hydroxy-tetrahydrodipicolinate synthase